MHTKTAGILRGVLCVLLGAVLAFAAVRWLLPLLVAWGAAALLEPLVGKLNRRGLGRGVCAGVCLLAVLGILCGLLWLPLHRLGRELQELWKNLPSLFSTAEETLNRWEALLRQRLSEVPEGLRVWLDDAMESGRKTLSAVPGRLSDRVLTLLPALVAKTPAALLSAITCVIGTFFISASYPEILHGAARLLPEKLLCRGRLLRRDLRKTLGRWLRAQL